MPFYLSPISFLDKKKIRSRTKTLFSSLPRTDTVTRLLRIEQVPTANTQSAHFPLPIFLLSSSSFARRFASCFGSVKFHIDTRRFQSAAEVELVPVYMFDFYEMLFIAEA